MNPPDHAIVICLAKKSQVQALARTRLLLPVHPGISTRQTHDYIRHGTTSLFAPWMSPPKKSSATLIAGSDTRSCSSFSARSTPPCGPTARSTLSWTSPEGGPLVAIRATTCVSRRPKDRRQDRECGRENRGSTACSSSCSDRFGEPIKRGATFGARSDENPRSRAWGEVR
jgi:hypothetical protein